MEAGEEGGTGLGLWQRYHDLYMKYLGIIALALSAGIAGAQDTKTPAWSYSGSSGPGRWGDLSPSNSACKSGKEQSPIDIRNATSEDLPPIRFEYKSALLRIVNNGHTAEVIYPAGSVITVGSERYELKQIHFHRPSEERIGGKAFDMVIHLVHANMKNELAVVAVLLQQGPSSASLDKIFAAIPKAVNKEVEVKGTTINAADLLPRNTGYYTYGGSLTTPPCSEGVTWFILKTPATVSSAELKTFATFFEPNARSVQQLGARVVHQSR